MQKKKIDRRMKVQISECKTIAEWLKRCGPFDSEQITVDLAAGVPIQPHEAVWLLLRHMKQGSGPCPVVGSVMHIWGERSWDEPMRQLTGKPAIRAIGDKLFEEFNKSRTQKRKLEQDCRRIDWHLGLRASIFGDDDSPIKNGIEQNCRMFQRGLTEMQVYTRLRFQIVVGEYSSSNDIEYSIKNPIPTAQDSTIVFVKPPENIYSQMAVRRPRFFAQYVHSPNDMTLSGVNIVSSHNVLVTSRKTLGYVGPACPQNGIYEVTWIRDGGSKKPPREEAGLMFSRELLPEIQKTDRFFFGLGEKNEHAWNRGYELFMNYYVTKNKELIKTLREIAQCSGR